MERISGREGTGRGKLVFLVFRIIMTYRIELVFTIILRRTKLPIALFFLHRFPPISSPFLPSFPLILLYSTTFFPAFIFHPRPYSFSRLFLYHYFRTLLSRPDLFLFASARAPFFSRARSFYLISSSFPFPIFSQAFPLHCFCLFRFLRLISMPCVSLVLAPIPMFFSSVIGNKSNIFLKRDHDYDHHDHTLSRGRPEGLSGPNCHRQPTSSHQNY